MKDDQTSAHDSATDEGPQPVLGPDHPFVRLVGDDPRLTRAMTEALRTLQGQATDDRLKEKIGEAAAGHLPFADLLADRTFGETFTPSQNTEQALTLTREDMSRARQDEIAEAAREHVARLTDHEALVAQVRKVFGPLAD